MKEEWKNIAENCTVKISTPYSAGNGVVLCKYNLIVTNEHIVRENKVVIIEGYNYKRQKVEVLYLDEKNDLAFLSLPIPIDKHLTIETLSTNEIDNIVFAFGYSGSQQYKLIKGKIKDDQLKIIEKNSILHSAYLDYEYNGCPLINGNCDLLGINTFFKEGGEEKGKAIFISKIIERIEKYKNHYPYKGIVCVECDTIIIDKKGKNINCDNCGNRITSISEFKNYEPRGVDKLIEDVIIELGFDVEISRRGNSKWEIDEGSALMVITYQEKTGFMVAEATLANISDDSMLDVYTYLMKQNYFNKGMSFCIKDESIILSLIIYDQHLHFETCKKLLGNLIKSADRYDDILINGLGVL